MSLRGRSIVITGEVWCSEDLAIEGRVEGPVWCEGRAVTIAAGAQVAGDVIARDISVFGVASGQLIATEVVDLRPGSTVTGSVIAPSLVLHDGARFNGRVEPQRLDAALSVAKFQLKQKGSKTG
jgi:cytoskeletal protein CcmA (bactofilin family)